MRLWLPPAFVNSIFDVAFDRTLLLISHIAFRGIATLKPCVYFRVFSGSKKALLKLCGGCVSFRAHFHHSGARRRII
jgi:hypothetical protein